MTQAAVHEIDSLCIELPKGKIIGNRWKIVKKLGEGGCGTVYKVLDVNDKKKTMAALKAEMNRAEISVLKLEVAVLKRLQGKPHTAQLLHSGRKEKFSYMVMTLLGETLADLIRPGKIVSLSTQIRVGINILFGVKQLHDVGYVHRDLKPTNVAVGCKDTLQARLLLIIDFGLAREFIVEENGISKLRPPRDSCLFRGTPRYCSIATHKRHEQGRVDDLWSMMFMLAELRGTLPWDIMVERDQILKSKESTNLAVLFGNSPIELYHICKELTSLHYYSRPDYAKIHKLFAQALAYGSFSFSDPWDWEKEFFSFKTKKDTYQKDIQEKRTANETAGHGASKPTAPMTAGTGTNLDKTIVTHSYNVKTMSARTIKRYYGDSPFPIDDFASNPLGF